MFPLIYVPVWFVYWNLLLDIAKYLLEKALYNAFVKAFSMHGSNALALIC